MLAVRPINFPVAYKSKAPAWLANVGNGSPQVQTAFAADSAALVGMSEQEMMHRQLAEAMARAEAEGRTRGEAAGRAHLDELVLRIEQIYEDLIEVRQRIFSSMEEQMTDLALQVAQSILETELQTNREHVLRLVRQAVSLVACGDQIDIFVAPQDYQLFGERISAIAQEIPQANKVLVKADENISAGCVVETQFARVDTTISSRLRNVADALHAEGGQ